jgi:hypothetical protein
LLPVFPLTPVSTEHEKLARESRPPHEMTPRSEASASIGANPVPDDHLLPKHPAEKRAKAMSLPQVQHYMKGHSQTPEGGALQRSSFLQGPRSVPPSLMDLIHQQSWEGFFNIQGAVRETVLSNFPFKLLDWMQQLFTGDNRKKTRETNALASKSKSDLLCETIIVIFYIENEYASSSELWDLLVRKAREWVQNEMESKIARDASAELVRKHWRQSDDIFQSRIADKSQSVITDTFRFFSGGNVDPRKSTSSMKDVVSCQMELGSQGKRKMIDQDLEMDKLGPSNKGDEATKERGASTGQDLKSHNEVGSWSFEGKRYRK